MSDCPTPGPPFNTPTCNCKYPPTVKLDPSTKAGASCLYCGYPPSVGVRDEVCVINAPPFTLSE